MIGQATILKTPKKTTGKENRDEIADRSLQGKGRYQDCNSRAEKDKEVAPYKSTGDLPLIPEPSLNTLMILATCSLQGKKGESNPNFSPVCSNQRPDI